MDGIVQDAFAEQWLDRPAVNYVAGAVKDLVNVEFQPRVFEDSHGMFRIEFHQHVDVAVRSGFASRDGTEDGSVGYAEPPQLGFVSAERVENAVQDGSHASVTSLPKRAMASTPVGRAIFLRADSADRGGWGMFCDMVRLADIVSIVQE